MTNKIPKDMVRTENKSVTIRASIIRRSSLWLMGIILVAICQLVHSYPLGGGVLSSSFPRCPQSRQPVVSLDGDWSGAKAALRSPECCVVSVPGLETHLRVLQENWVNDNGGSPANLDLRARVRVQSSAYDDCLRISNSVSPIEEFDGHDGSCHDKKKMDMGAVDPCTVALMELSRGVASLADGSLEGVCTDVFIRIVCASEYKARDPMFHTDKAPLRGYVTLRGVGTEFMTRPSTPLEYLTLRGLGMKTEGKERYREPAKSVRQAKELEFIVMKGDHYEAPPPATDAPTSIAIDSWMRKVWKRTSACVHRSPPGGASSGRRVIISLDLADGDDDREWYEANKKREWRSGMTQRKSRLVA